MSNTKNENKSHAPKMGGYLIYGSLIVTTILWILSKPAISDIWNWPILSFNQISALLGTILFAWSFILATRLDILEKLFGGLDRVYKIHRKVSEIGAVLILLHPVALILNSPNRISEYLLPISTQQGVNIGIYSFWIFVALILLTLLVHKLKIPYHIWKQTHKFINLAMILALIHVVMIESDVSVFLPLGVWMNTFIAFAVASGLYKSFFYSFFGPRYTYKIDSIKFYDGVYDVRLKAIGRELPYKLAQFAYVAFKSKGISKESHPYCITSIPGEKTLRFCIKELGDYTKKLGALSVGDTAVVWGSHGKLGERFDDKKEDAVFIAGGIGIAPFLSMFKKASESEDSRNISLFYCTKYKDDAVFGPELEKLQRKSTHLYYQNQCSREPGGCHLTAAQVAGNTRKPKDTIAYLCGPQRMMKSLADDLVEQGFSQSNIVFEDFEML